jgi:hypothetical protein
MEAMTGKRSDHTALIRLADAFVKDVLNESDEDILAEACEDHADPATAAAQTRGLFEKAMAMAGKGRLAAAKAALAKRPLSPTVARLDPAEARRRLDRILAHDPDTARKLTLAARNGQGLSDDDVQGMLDDLAELGITPDHDKS